MANCVTVQIQMDKDLSDKFEKFCAEVGLSTTAAFCLFANKTISEQRIPFSIGTNIPNDTTQEALSEIRKMKQHPEDYKQYNNFKELMDEVLEDA